MSGPVSIRRSLSTNLLAVILLLSGAIMAATFFGSKRTVFALTEAIISRTIDVTEGRLQQFFQPVVNELQLMSEWGTEGLLDVDQPRALNRLLVPVLRGHPQVSSVVIADARGHEYMLLHTPSQWLNRQTRRDTWGSRTRWLAWTDAQPEPHVYWKPLDYDPRQRPWYLGALQQRQRLGTAAPVSGAVQLVHWTRPYTFYTVQQPGMTASISYVSADGKDHVIGFDVLLEDLSKFTSGLNVSEHGKVVVLTDDGRVIGLPSDPRYASNANRRAALLKLPRDLGITLATDAADAFAARGGDTPGPLRFVSNGQPWWGEARPFHLGEDRQLWTVVLVPEADLLGRLAQIRLWIVLITLAVLVIAISRAVTLARRYSRPLEILVQQSDRISRLNLYRGKPIRSRVIEVQRLAEAHERMRRSLQTLLKLERDLQLAREIQQNTFPEALPQLPGYEMEAWSEPAEQTGGDTYDVIGYRPGGEAGERTLAEHTAQGCVLLLADATGHGIGPALSATQIRAMLRMAVRLGHDLSSIVQHLNEQLCADLHAGRFITAWLGDLDSKTHTLRYFSAGQAPLLVFRAAAQQIEVLPATAPPFGVIPEMDTTHPSPLALEPGDMVAVFSDGILQAANHAGKVFGEARATALMRDHRGASAQAIMAALRTALQDFAGTVAAADDRTALIIKRKSS